MKKIRFRSDKTYFSPADSPEYLSNLPFSPTSVCFLLIRAVRFERDIYPDSHRLKPAPPRAILPVPYHSPYDSRHSPFRTSDHQTSAIQQIRPSRHHHDFRSFSPFPQSLRRLLTNLPPLRSRPGNASDLLRSSHRSFRPEKFQAAYAPHKCHSHR